VTKITDFIIKSKLPAEFVEYIDVFDTEKAGVLLTYNKNKHTINLNGNKSFFGPLYNLSAKKLEVLRTYLNAALAKRWIRRSTSPTRALILFSLKKDGSLRLCVNYRGLNKITIKDRYSLSLINKTLAVAPLGLRLVVITVMINISAMINFQLDFAVQI
jgi:hypothetical protein